jgi:AMP phosphorylase
MPVDLDLEEMKRVVEKTNGCIVWGGTLHLAPADDIFIQVEYPLSIDPLLLPSIMSKKKAVGVNNLVIDIPCGRGTKIKTIGDADLLAKDFIELGKRLGINTRCAVTYGEQPLGYTIGPALEAKEALEVIMRRKVLPDLIDKATDIAGILLEMCGKKNGKELALEILRSGKAEEKLREIIFEQGGSPEIKPEDIEIGSYGLDFYSKDSGIVLWINNSALVEIARAAGAPKDKKAGILLYKKFGDAVKKDEKLFTVYCEKERKLERVRKILDEEQAFGIGSRMEMLIHEVKEIPVHKKVFILER